MVISLVNAGNHQAPQVARSMHRNTTCSEHGSFQSVKQNFCDYSPSHKFSCVGNEGKVMGGQVDF